MARLTELPNLAQGERERYATASPSTKWKTLLQAASMIPGDFFAQSRRECAGQ
jgi:hypothetical protein